MEELKPPTNFDNISQRTVYSYIRQLQGLPSFIPENLSKDEQLNIQISQNELSHFFQAFYQHAYDSPELFGLPVKEDAYFIHGLSKEEKQAISIQFKKPRVILDNGIDFLSLIGLQGVLANGSMHLSNQVYAEYFAKNPRVKRKFLAGMENVGLALSEQDKVVVVCNPMFPNMMLALKALAEACAQYEETRIGKFLFSLCDFRTLEANYQPDVLDILKSVTTPSEYSNIVDVHRTLCDMSYKPTLNIGGIHEWRIQYQGNRKIKSTPFFEFEYDERQQDQIQARIKCASTNRLVPLLQKQPDSLQKDFFLHAHNCAGSSCGWCDTRKALEPSLITYEGEHRTICWWMQRQFSRIDYEVVDLVKQYGLFHEALLN